MPNKHDRRMADYDQSARQAAKRTAQIEDRRKKRQAFLDRVRSVVEAHQSSLAIKRTLLVGIDEFGTKNHSRWNRFIVQFYDTVILPKLEQDGLLKVEYELVLYNYSDPSVRQGNWKKLAEKKLLVDVIQMIDEMSIKLNPTNVCTRNIDDCTPAEYERECGLLLESVGFTVHQIGGSGDQGVDIVAINRIGIRVAIQCKRTSRPVGNTAIQEVFAGAKFHSCSHAIVVCNAGFTSGAIQAAERTGVVLLHHLQLLQWAQSLQS